MKSTGSEAAREGGGRERDRDSELRNGRMKERKEEERR